MTRQYRWSKKMESQGRCRLCGKRRVSKNFCRRHRDEQRACAKARYATRIGRPIRLLRCGECGKAGHNARSHTKTRGAVGV